MTGGLITFFIGLPAWAKAALLGLLAFIAVVASKIKTVIALYKGFKQVSSIPEDRKEKIGEVDEHGFVQVKPEPLVITKPSDTPSGVKPEIVVATTGTATLKPDEPVSTDSGSTDDLIKKLDEEIRSS